MIGDESRHCSCPRAPIHFQSTLMLRAKLRSCSHGHRCSRAQMCTPPLKVHRSGPGWHHSRLSRNGPGFDPRSGLASWVRFFRGFSSPVRQMSGSFRPPRSPNIIWPTLSSINIHYGGQWPEMLTRPKASNIHNPPLKMQKPRTVKWIRDRTVVTARLLICTVVDCVLNNTSMGSGRESCRENRQLPFDYYTIAFHTVCLLWLVSYPR